MINKLVLTNFQRHEDLTLDFTNGLNAIRGANENGKSSVFRGIAYAFFGSRALPMSLEETVTWGKPVASLKVELTFTHSGKQFKIVRKKSGAELVGDGVTASGQAEVTAFVENLFGASAAIAQATMLANQSSLQNGLDSSAMPLIEKLANMSLIDDLIGKVQTKLPSGSTKGVEAQLATVSAAEEPVLETSELDFKISELQLAVQKLTKESVDAATTLSHTQTLAMSGQTKQNSNKTLETLKASLQSQLESLRPKLNVPAFEPQDVKKLEELAKQAEQSKALQQAWAKFQSLPISNVMSVTDHEAQTKAVSAQLSDAAQRCADLKNWKPRPTP
jgi:DNA repair exonuclease SbcCD ATPase subunit